MKKALFLLTTGLLAAASNVNAAETLSPSIYAGASAVYVDYSEGDIDMDLGAILGRVGTQLTDYVALEARLGTGVSDDSLYGVELELNYMYGLYAKAGFENNGFYPYVVLGYTKGELEASYGGYHENASDSDLSYGAGIDYAFTDRVSGNIEYMSYLDKDGYELNGFSAGFTYKF
ncbi:porin family protein [Alteromonas lipolytica]|uniref:Outer membrane protein beta-barrel domain-containing protein n=1 Tax=Alteromonas lipolytica TaxID=1856405 RepID=A0A1E8FB35_9ALTE|nr:porin family protein [Alteromonas lipolytica]OFI32996.1 hypothetical protein BFC17_01605 [Alteromonas lipolytica]GGF63481.1 hypothetical protein GCM10011338_14850 [Alteromonas lipolytica]